MNVLSKGLPPPPINVDLLSSGISGAADATKNRADEPMSLLDGLEFDLDLAEPLIKMQRERPARDIMTMEELMAAS